MPSQTVDPQVEAIWRERMTQLETSLHAEPFNKAAFADAVAFFEGTTGIPSESMTYLGVLPVRIGEAIDQWKRWYRQNGASLWVDQESKTIRVRHPPVEVRIAPRWDADATHQGRYR